MSVSKKIPPKKEGGLRLNGKFKSGSEHSPLITIITSVLNGAKTIESSIKSVIDQTYPNIEYIVIDAVSKDRTIDILEENSSCIDYWISEPDKGIYDAWNKGVALASGEWVLFLGADDFLKPTALSLMIDCANTSNEKLEYISGKAELIKEGRVIQTVGLPWSWKKFKKYCCTAQVGALHNKLLYERLGGYDTTYKSSGDYEFLLRAGKELKAAYVDKVTISMSLGGISNSSLLPIWETYYAIKKHSTINPFISFMGLIKSLLSWKVKRLLGLT